jgi:hypothetical protein
MFLLLAGSGVIRAQEETPVRIDVFVGRDAETGEPNIFFVDALSGLSTVVNASSGQRFTLVGDYVLYQKATSGAIMRATANGMLEPHAFIQQAVDTQAVRWITSPDQQAIAWVRVTTGGDSEAYVAWADGSDLRQLPIASPGPAFELVPVALTDDMTAFYYDAAHPADTPVDMPFATFEQIVEYNITAEAFYELPDEPNCPCGAAFSADGRIFARLEADEGQGPFGLHVWDLPTDADISIPAANLPYRRAGDLLLNSTGTFAVYGVASDVGAENDAPETRYALALVDIVAGQQYLVLEPGPERYRPVAFIDTDSALLLAGDEGTYKFDLASGALQRVSNAVYLGTITP